MDIPKSIWIFCQVIIGYHLVLPLIFYLFFLVFGRKRESTNKVDEINDYAIIVTAYSQTDLLPSVVESILKLNYSLYKVYVVADNCDISNLNFNNDKIILLRPEEVLASNIKSHFYAISHFERVHTHLTIIDSDNLVDPEYLNELNIYFNLGFLAVQGVRAPKNLNTVYACLDAASDIFYRFIDRKLLFSLGSSAALSGSGMSFTTSLYQECLGGFVIEGAGFDKVLQLEIQKRDLRVAFAEKAIVFDEKTSKSDQLVKQRSRWIFTWFKYLGAGIQLILQGLFNFSWNQFSYGLFFTRPPLFILGLLSLIFFITDLLFFPQMAVWWTVAIAMFIIIFFISLIYFNTPRVIYISLFSFPIFIFFQIISLFKAKNSNKISVATEHFQIVDNDDLKS